MGKQIGKIDMVLFIVVIGVFYLNEKKSREENLKLQKERQQNSLCSIKGKR